MEGFNGSRTFSEKKTTKCLDKYLLHHNLKASLSLGKKQKVVVITQHLSNSLLEAENGVSKQYKRVIQINEVRDKLDDVNQAERLESDTDSNYSDSDDDEVVNETIDSEEEIDEEECSDDTSEEQDNKSDFDVNQMFTKTGSGRVCGGWRLHQYK